jgi:hypothetical protein
MPNGAADKSLESRIWDVACSNRGVMDASKYYDYKISPSRNNHAAGGLSTVAVKKEQNSLQLPA